MAASASETTRIPVSCETRKELRLVKAEQEKHSYDDAIRHLLERDN